MPIADLSDLVQTTSDYVKRGDMGAIIDRLIGFAENDIERAIQFGEQHKSVALALANGRATLPTDFYAMRSVSTTGLPTQHLSRIAKHLEQLPDECRARGYTMDANDLVVMPKQIEEVLLSYFARIPRLTPAQPTNWLLARAPDLVLAGVIYHALEWAGDERVERAAVGFQERMKTIRREESARRWTNAVIMPGRGAGLP